MQEPVTPDQWRELVGRHIEARRHELRIGSRYKASDPLTVSESWWRQMETGAVRRTNEIVAPNPRADNVKELTDRLQWPADAIDRLLAGEVPDESWHTPHAAPRRNRVVQRDYNSDIGELPPDDQEIVDNLLDSLLRKQQG